ncbi:MAG: threonine synthase [Balneolaceae bacterium]|nr:MAG: threonine synthase [Balneolaceae bacterium]
MALSFISTSGHAPPVSFLEAMRTGLAPDGGLYMPSHIPMPKPGFWKDLSRYPFTEIAYNLAKPWLEGELSESKLLSVAEDAFNFELKLVPLAGNQYVLELFHGPTLAFKDFGARFMARLFSEIADREEKTVNILVATSGDTGSAVAHGFYKVPGVKVFLLYPKGKVSRLQEMQMATLGENVTTLEVDGVFDDCQALVKQAFTDSGLQSSMQLSSANSINVARLLPQSFYYGWAAGQLMKEGVEPPVFCVPSGNFGNLTGGLLAERMGLPVHRFIAATNRNAVVPVFLNGGEYRPAPSVQTLSNAMDVGNPSNFVRIRHLFGMDDHEIRKQIRGYSYSDAQTRSAMETLFRQQNYLACPHTAVGLRAAAEYQKEEQNGHPVVTLATAHPVKFRDVIEPVTGKEIPVPERLQQWLNREKKSIPIRNSYSDFSELLHESRERNEV